MPDHGGSFTPCRQFLLKVPADSTLVAEVEWDVNFYGILLVLTTEAELPAVRGGFPPFIGRWRVVSGQEVRLSIGVAGADFLREGVFTLRTSLE